MLEDGPPVEVVLAQHVDDMPRLESRPERAWRMRWHAVRLIQHPPRHVKRLLVTVHVLVIEVRVLVEMHGQRERFPGARLVDHHLARLEGRLPPVGHPTRRPDRAPGSQAPDVRPEDGSGLTVRLGLEQEGRLDDGHVVGVE